MVSIKAQTYSPITVTGFTQDIFAEAGTDAQATTSTLIDGTNHVMYTEGFASSNGLNAGVLNSGTITNGNHTFQLASFNNNNSIYLSLNGNVANSSASNTLTLQTPAKYSAISFLGFSTEGVSTVSLTLNFTDGTTANLGNVSFSDWFGGASIFYAGFGRINRLAAPPYSVDGLPADPRWYKYDFFIGCGNQNKFLQSVTVNYVAQGGTSGRAIILAASGAAYTPFSTSGVVTPVTCGGNNGSIALTATGGIAPLSYVWNTTPAQFTSTATGLAAGSYTATVTDAYGCTTNYTGTVTQTATITASASASPASICSGDSATLTATSTGGTNNTYTWSPGGLTRPVIKVSPADTTIYTVTLTDGSSGTSCIVTATTTVLVKKKPIAAFVASPQRFCLRSADTIRFTGTAGNTAVYNWNFDNANIISGSGVGPYVIQFPTSGSHMIKLLVAENGCSSSEATQTVIADNPSQPAFTVAPTSICSGDTVLVTFTGTAAAGATQNWNWGGGTVISGNGMEPYAVKYIATSTIQLIINNNSCADTSASQTVAITPLPVAAFTPSILQGCIPQTISFINNSQNGITYLWNFGDNSNSTDQTPQSHIYNLAGNYPVTLTVTNGNCGSVSAAQIIRIANPPVADFSSTPLVTATPLQLSQAQFNFINNSTGAISYQWYFSSKDSSRLTNPVHRYITPGSFNVILYAFTDVGCSDSVSIGPYIIIADSALRVPNAFSPNNDGINDRWQVPGLLGYPDCRVEVFDRYGKIVFSSTGYNVPWDGKRNNSEVPIGTYYYIIRTSLKNYTGWVFLVR